MNNHELDRIDVGEYIIYRMSNGNYWIADKTGEGMEVGQSFEKLIHDFYVKEL